MDMKPVKLNANELTRLHKSVQDEIERIQEQLVSYKIDLWNKQQDWEDEFQEGELNAPDGPFDWGDVVEHDCKGDKYVRDWRHMLRIQRQIGQLEDDLKFQQERLKRVEKTEAKEEE